MDPPKLEPVDQPMKTEPSPGPSSSSTPNVGTERTTTSVNLKTDVKPGLETPATSAIRQASDTFDWSTHLEAIGSDAVDESAFVHVTQSSRTLAEYTVQPGTVVRIRPSSNAERLSLGRIEVICGACCRVYKVALIVHEHNDSCNKLDYENSTVCMQSSWRLLDLADLTFVKEAEFDSLPSALRTKLALSDQRTFNLSDNEDSCSSASSTDSVMLHFHENDKLAFGASKMGQALTLNSLAAPPIDWLRPGAFVEVQFAPDPTIVDLAQIEANNGGYLTLRVSHGEAKTETEYIFWLHERVHAVGWCLEENRPVLGYRYRSERLRKSALTLVTMDASMAQSVNAAIVPPALFQLPFTRHNVFKHRFQVGMRLEMVDPRNQVDFIPAAVVQVLNVHYVVVEADTLKSASDDSSSLAHTTGGNNNGVVPAAQHVPVSTFVKVQDGVQVIGKQTAGTNHSQRTIHSASPYIFHVYWSNRSGVRIKPPNGFGNKDFSWQSYRQLTGLTCNSDTPAAALDAVSDKRDMRPFVCGRKLEVVDPSDRSRLLPATVTRQTKNLIWIRFDHTRFATHSIVYDSRSVDLFPCGWAQRHGVTLVPPATPVDAFLQSVDELDQTLYQSERTNIFTPRVTTWRYMSIRWLRSVWLPPIYVNNTCCCGPYLASQRVAALPRVIGPGPLGLIVQTVANFLISCGQRPATLLELWQPDKTSDGPRKLQLPVKARFKGRRYRGGVVGCNDWTQLGAWVHHLLTSIDACPSLISTRQCTPCTCPSQCHLRLAHLPFMKSGQHPCTGAVASRSSRATNKRRQRRPNQIADLCHPPPVIRKRTRTHANLAPKISPTNQNNSDNSNGPRRPVTRGIKLPKLSPATHAMVITSPLSASQQAAGRVKRRMGLGDHHDRRNSFLSRQHGGVRSPEPRRHSAMSPNRDTTHSGKPMGIAIPQMHNTGNRHIMAVPHSQALQCRDVYTLAADGTSVTRYPVPPIHSNPNDWTPGQLATWLKRTDLVAFTVINNLVQEDVDGQAFLLLTLRDCMEYLGMKLGPALKICSLIQELKIAFLQRYSSQHGRLPMVFTAPQPQPQHQEQQPQHQHPSAGSSANQHMSNSKSSSATSDTSGYVRRHML